MSKKEEVEYEEYESLKNSKFKQQKLPGWRPVPSMFRTVTIFLSLGIVFAGLGVLILFFSNDVEEINERYDNECYNNETCNIPISINKTMKNIFVYYKLDGFYQNHPRYIRSRSEAQLKGEKVTKEELENDCHPIIKNREINNVLSNELINNGTLDPNDTAYPCGLMAKYFFTDKFTFYFKNDTQIHVNEHNISRKSDKNKYKAEYNSSRDWIDMKDEHFLVWMRPSPFTNFNKLWGRMETDLDKGENIIVKINNTYRVDNFNGKKYIVLRSINNFGGKNKLLAIGYMIFGGISIFLGIFFIITFKARAKKEK